VPIKAAVKDCEEIEGQPAATPLPLQGRATRLLRAVAQQCAKRPLERPPALRFDAGAERRDAARQEPRGETVVARSSKGHGPPERRAGLS
jgi:hypothetical protein